MSINLHLMSFNEFALLLGIIYLFGWERDERNRQLEPEFQIRFQIRYVKATQQDNMPERCSMAMEATKIG